MTELEFMQFPAIDLHGHCGVVPDMPEPVRRFVATPVDEIVARATACAITTTVVSNLDGLSIADIPTDTDTANDIARNAAEQFDALRFYVLVNPTDDGWAERTECLFEHPKCAGAKLHSRWNHWDVGEYGDRVFAFLSERQALVLVHTGNIGSEPERFVDLANTHSGVRLIVAHTGHDETDNTRDRQVRALHMSTRGNVWADTSSAKSITPNVIEHAVSELGPERIVFGTDTPLYFSAMQKARIAYAGISDDAKRKILYENAAALLGIDP